MMRLFPLASTLHTAILNRAGSGHFFHGAGRVSGLGFWPGSGSGQFGPPFWADFF